MNDYYKIIKECKKLKDDNDKSVIRFNQLAGKNIFTPVVVTNAEFPHVLIEVSSNREETQIGVSVIVKETDKYASSLSFVTRDYHQFITLINSLKKWTPQ